MSQKVFSDPQHIKSLNAKVTKKNIYSKFLQMSGDQDDEKKKKIHVKHENKFLIIQVINVMFLRLSVHLYLRLFIHFVIISSLFIE